ncbi:MAG: DUF2867 domain-containing protein [Acidobacteriota bacterium]
MQLDTQKHLEQPFRVHEYAREFELLDLWQYPIEAESEEEFDTFLEIHDLAEMAAETSLLVRALFGVRLALGNVFGWDGESGSEAVGLETVFREPREVLMRTENKTVTALLHLSWVELENGRFTARLAVYAISHGALGRGYMALIAPFRNLWVYPSLMKVGGRRWRRRHELVGRAQPARH